MLVKGDFHIHSTASDGLLCPGEIVAVAKSRGMDIISITDHNTTSGIKEAADACKKQGISLIPGVELSTRFGNERIHLLGYFRNNRYLEDSFQYALKIAKDHEADKIRNEIKNYPYRKSASRYLSVLEGIKLLRFYDASVVLAHPVRISKENLMEILNYSFDGLEAKYCLSCSEETELFMKLALSRFSFYTGGSDFHSNKRNETKHCNIGEPFLNAVEILRFLKKSNAMVLS